MKVKYKYYSYFLRQSMTDHQKIIVATMCTESEFTFGARFFSAGSFQKTLTQAEGARYMAQAAEGDLDASTYYEER